MSWPAISGWSGTVDYFGFVRPGGHPGDHHVEALSWLTFGN
jgi:hypothetical protein